MDAKRNGSAKRHPIQVVARRTGLTADVLRAWEKRYGVVEPSRSDGGRRLYSDEDVERLRLLHRASEAGRRIGRIAGLSTEALRDLVREDERQEARAPGPGGPAPGAGPHLAAAWRAMDAFDARTLESVLLRATLSLGAPAFVEEVAAPLLRRVGDGWARGEVHPGNEHLASAVLRQVLASLVTSCAPAGGAPTLVVATPSGQGHEFGALFAAAVGAADGWRVVYLGADLPGDEIARTADRTGAAAVVLSLVHPEADPATAAALAELGETLDEDTALLAGGAAAPSYGPALGAAGAELVDDLQALRVRLDRVAAARPA
ncbi:MAG: MerR family transcriptional regulator [Gemmatimonadota bacterium]|nr:MerR family transcriptional regulator [Gemmatimonadota bacterium]